MVDSESIDFAQVLPFCSIHYLLCFCGIHHIQDMANAMYKVCLYKRGCGIHHIQGFGLWNTPHTRYGIRHVQELFIQEVVEYTTYKVLVCGIHHILDMAYAMFKLFVQ